VIDLKKILAEKVNKLDLQIADVKFERDNSATPMESASDKSRQLAEQLMDALNDERKKLILLNRKISEFKNNKIFTIKTPLGEREFVLVPEGLGGKTVDGVTLLSEVSPLGKNLIGKKVGDIFEYNNQSFRIISLRN
jgi:hypothetical protein